MVNMNPKITFQPGARIADKFEVIEYIGEGSLEDDVYIGKQLDLDRKVTIRIMPKSLSNDKELVQRFTQEIRMTASLHHPNILQTIEQGEYTGRLYFTTAAEDGTYLNDYLSKKGALEEKQAVKDVTALADALKYAWNTNKILHRNVKPSTIILTDAGTPILEDFGMAKSFSDESVGLTMAGVTIGNPQYMSPEQVKGQADLDFRSDIYCLGLVFYEMLTSQKAFVAKTDIALMEAQLQQEPVSVKEINESITDNTIAVLSKMLSKDRYDRQESWEELIDELNNVDRPKLTIKKEEPKVKAQPASALAAEQAKTGTVAIVIGVILVLIIIGLVAALLLK